MQASESIPSLSLRSACQVYQPSGTVARQAVLALCSFVLSGDLFEEKYGSRLQSSISFTWQVIEVIAM